MRAGMVLLCLGLLAMAGCDQVGHTRAIIEIDQYTHLNGGPVPVEIDPALLASGEVTVNTVHKPFWSIMEMRQHIVVHGPATYRLVRGNYLKKIEPAEVPATQPATTRP